jgi:hypothetical protein
MLSQQIADQIYTFIDTELQNVSAPIPDCNRTEITEFLRKNIEILPEELFQLLETLGKKSFAIHMAFNKLFSAKNNPKPNDIDIENATTLLNTAKNKLSRTIELCQAYKIDVEGSFVEIPELTLKSYSFSNESQRDVARQIEVIELHITRLKQQQERLLKAEESEDALICYEYDVNSPSAIYVGDTISTKFGCGIVVTAVDKEKSQFSYVNDHGETESLCSSRFSGVEKYVNEI